MKAPSPEFIEAFLHSTNRHFGGPSPIQFGIEDLKDIFGDEYLPILAAAEELCSHLSTGTMEVKWGHDDEGNFSSLPPNEGDGPDSDNPPIFDLMTNFRNWEVMRTANGVYICPRGSSGAGPVTIWFTPKGK